MPRGKKVLGKGDHVLVRVEDEGAAGAFAESGTVRAVIDGDSVSYRVEVDRTGELREVPQDAVHTDVAGAFRKKREASDAPADPAASSESALAAQ